MFSLVEESRVCLGVCVVLVVVAVHGGVSAVFVDGVVSLTKSQWVLDWSVDSQDMRDFKSVYILQKIDLVHINLKSQIVMKTLRLQCVKLYLSHCSK